MDRRSFLAASGACALAAAFPSARAQAIATKEWGSAQALVVDAGKLYAATTEGVFELNLASGQDRRIGSPRWRGVTRMAMLDGDLCFVADGDLWALKPGGGEPRKLGSSFSPVAGLAAHDGALYIVNDDTLVSVTASGAFKRISQPWYSTIGLASVGKTLYAVANGKLQAVDLPKGAGRVLVDLDKPGAMAALGSRIYVFTFEGPNGNRRAFLLEYDTANGSRRKLALPFPWENAFDPAPAMAAADGKLYFAMIVNGKVNVVAHQPQ